MTGKPHEGVAVNRWAVSRGLRARPTPRASLLGPCPRDRHRPLEPALQRVPGQSHHRDLSRVTKPRPTQWPRRRTATIATALSLDPVPAQDQVSTAHVRNSDVRKAGGAQKHE